MSFSNFKREFGRPPDKYSPSNGDCDTEIEPATAEETDETIDVVGDGSEFDDDDEGLMMLEPTDLIALELRESGLPGPPDGGWGYVIVFASFCINLVMDGVTSSFSVLLPQIVATFRENSPDVGVSDVAWAGSLLCGVSLCIGPVTSAITNKFGCRIVCMSGALIAAAGFASAAYAPNLQMLLLTYGLLAGVGFGMLYLPAIVCVSYYFERKRAFATGLAVSGSGFGAIAFAPLITSLSQVADWRTVCLGFAGLLALLVLAGATMRPLKLKIDTGGGPVPKVAPLLQRMADEKKNYLEKGSFVGSHDYFMVQLPDGTIERRLKVSCNVDPGVHSGLYLDQLLVGSGGVAMEGVGTPVPAPPVSGVDILPTITETTKPVDSNAESSSGEDVTASTKLAVSSAVLANGVSVRPGSPTYGYGSTPHAHNRPEHWHMTDGLHSPHVEQPPTENGRRRQVSEGEQHERAKGHDVPLVANANPTSGLARFFNLGPRSATATEIARKPSFTRSIGSRGVFVSRGSGSGSHFGRNSSTDLGATPSPQDKKYAIRAVPTSTSLSHSVRVTGRKRSLGSGSGQFRMSGSRGEGMRHDRTRAGEDFLLSASEFSHVLRRSGTRKRSIPGAVGMGSGITMDRPHGRTTGPSSLEPEKIIIRTMSRKDVFYSGTIHRLEEFQSQSLSAYRQSVLNLPLKRVPTGAGTIDEESACGGEREPAPSAMGSFMFALTQMMDFSLVRNPAFLAIAMSGVIGMLGFYVPIVYAIDFATTKGIEETSAAYFISLVGVTSTVGRIGFGLLSDIRGVDSFLVYNMCIVVMGCSTIILPLASDFYFIAVLYTCFGLALSGFVSLSSIILVKLLGLENLTNSFGLLIFFRGLSTVIGTPLSGAIYDVTKSYDLPFYLAGAFLLISAVISLLSPAFTQCAGRIREVRETRKMPTHTAGATAPLEDIMEVIESSSEGEPDASLKEETKKSEANNATTIASTKDGGHHDHEEHHHEDQVQQLATA